MFFKPEQEVNGMTEFVHKPYDKIYVRDMIKLNLDDLIGMMSSSFESEASSISYSPSSPSALMLSHSGIDVEI